MKMLWRAQIMGKLERSFFARNTLTVAQELLGKILVHQIEGTTLKGMIVETEAYLGLSDKAAHSYSGKITKRVETMYKQPGTAYVYFIWGMHYCLNLITAKEGVPEGVLIRAIEPIENIEQMVFNRFNKRTEELTSYQKRNITNGPGKLTQAMKIDGSLNNTDLCKDILYVEEGLAKTFKIQTAKRIGIDYAQEAIDYPYRFYIKDNPYVSKL